MLRAIQRQTVAHVPASKPARTATGKRIIMASTCIIVADGARARFFTLESPEDPAADGGPRLLEHRDLVNPEADVPARGLFSDRSGRGHSSPGSAAHGLDDHRDQHIEELGRRFASRLVAETERFVQLHDARRLIVVAGPKLLGFLRTEIQKVRLARVEISEVSEYMAHSPTAEIHEALATRGLVRAPSAPAGSVYHPRGQPLPAQR